MKSKFLVFIAMVTSFQNALASAQPVLIQSSEVSSEEFQAYAKSEARTTWAESLAADRPSKENREKLIRLSKKAQRLWLSGQTTESRSAFNEIVALALEDDWNESQREAINYAQIRLAQSATSFAEKRERLQLAAEQFSDVKLSSDTFPPPLLAVFEELRAAVKSREKEIDLSEKLPDARFAYINGRKVDLTRRKRVRLPVGLFRMTALSDSKSSFSEKLTAADLNGFRVSSTPLASGTCQAPRFVDLEHSDIEALYGGFCLGRREKPPLHLGLSVANLSKSVANPSQSPAWPAEPPVTKGLSKKTWWWIGGAAALTGIAMIYMNHQDRKVEPTTRQGY